MRKPVLHMLSDPSTTATTADSRSFIHSVICDVNLLCLAKSEDHIFFATHLTLWQSGWPSDPWIAWSQPLNSSSTFRPLRNRTATRLDGWPSFGHKQHHFTAPAGIVLWMGWTHFDILPCHPAELGFHLCAFQPQRFRPGSRNNRIANIISCTPSESKKPSVGSLGDGAIASERIANVFVSAKSREKHLHWRKVTLTSRSGQSLADSSQKANTLLRLSKACL
jgi:hypothetical protein